MIKVSVVGAKGRMGSYVVEAVNNAADTQLALALDAGDDLTRICLLYTSPSPRDS